jgi:hypothetical protein
LPQLLDRKSPDKSFNISIIDKIQPSQSSNIEEALTTNLSTSTKLSSNVFQYPSFLSQELSAFKSSNLSLAFPNLKKLLVKFSMTIFPIG